MTKAEEHTLLEAYSRGDLTLRQLNRQIGGEWTFADAVIALAAHELNPPAPVSPEGSPGRVAVRELLAKRAHG